MDQTMEEILMSRDTVIFLLQHLGFVLNLEKSLLNTVWDIKLLGLTINSLMMCLFLPQEKELKIPSQCQDIHARRQRLTKLLGLLASTIQVVLAVPMMNFQYPPQQEIKALRAVFLNRNFKEELQRWIQWALPNSASKFFYNKDGCTQERLGSSLSWNCNRRGIEFAGKTTSYKCIGNEGSKTSVANISQAVSDESCSFPDRQDNSLVLSCEDRGWGGGGVGVWGQKQVFNRISKKKLEVFPTPWDHNYRRISSKLHERGGRLAVKKLRRPFEVEIPSTNISENLPDQRKTRN